MSKLLKLLTDTPKGGDPYIQTMTGLFISLIAALVLSGVMMLVYRLSHDWETYYKRGIIPEEYNQIELGFDQNKPVEELDIEDMRQAAAFRGGECLSETMEKGQLYKKLRWRCACGHEFEGTPYAILFAGHWCEDCMGAEWRYGDMADENPFFAQVWKPLHADDENFVVKTEFDPRIVKNKYEE